MWMTGSFMSFYTKDAKVAKERLGLGLGDLCDLGVNCMDGDRTPGLRVVYVE